MPRLDWGLLHADTSPAASHSQVLWLFSPLNCQCSKAVGLLLHSYFCMLLVVALLCARLLAHACRQIPLAMQSLLMRLRACGSSKSVRPNEEYGPYPSASGKATSFECCWQRPLQHFMPCSKMAGLDIPHSSNEPPISCSNASTQLWLCQCFTCHTCQQPGPQASALSACLLYIRPCTNRSAKAVSVRHAGRGGG